MKINAVFKRKDPEITPKECVIGYVKLMNDTKFNHFKNHLLENQAFIEEHLEDMYHDTDGTLHCLMAMNEVNGDGILIDSEGSNYARYSSFVPNIKPYIEQQIAIAAEHILSSAIFNNQTTFDLSELSNEIGITIVDDDGIGEMFVNYLREVKDIEHFEMAEGTIEVTLDSDMYPKHGLEMGGI